MALTKQQKSNILKDLQERMSRASVLLFANFHGLNVVKTRELRNLLREKGVDYKVAKKTLLQKAFQERNIGFDAETLKGEIAVVFGYDDPLEAVKRVWQFRKGNEKSFTVLAGVCFARGESAFGGENKILDSQMVEALATIPSREVLLGRVVGLLASPIRGMAAVLQGNIRNLLLILSNK